MMLSPRQAKVLLILGVLLMINGVLGIRWLFDGADTFSQTAGSSEYAVYQRVQLPLLIAAAVLLPALGRLKGTDGRGLPRWIVPAAVVAVILQACTTFVQGFTAPFLAGVAPASLDTQDGGLFEASMIVSWAIFCVTIVALAVVTWRRKVFSRPAALLIGFGALITPMFGPIGGVFVGTGLASMGRVPRIRE